MRDAELVPTRVPLWKPPQEKRHVLVGDGYSRDGQQSTRLLFEVVRLLETGQFAVQEKPNLKDRLLLKRMTGV